MGIPEYDLGNGINKNKEIQYIPIVKGEFVTNSVKPGVKIKYEKKKVIPKNKFVAMAVGASLFFIAGGITIPKVVDLAQNVKVEWEMNQYLSGEIGEVKTDIINPNTTVKYVSNPVEGTEFEETKTIHYHDMSKIMTGIQARTSDPIAAFYLLYQAMDSWCLEQGDVLRAYNATYGTSYESFEDFLLKNGFKDGKELKMHAGEVLKSEEEALVYGSSNIRGQ